MLKLAICDDNTMELAKLSDLVHEYLKEKNMEFQVSEFTHADQLLSICEKEIFQIYILDIVMPMLDGISLGCNLRRLDQEAQIIYATTESQFAFDAYAANPINFLVKPIDRNRLFDTLNLAVSKVKLSEESNITVKTSEGLRVLSISDISCCEYNNHSVEYTLLSGERIKSRTIKGKFLEHIAPLMKDFRFISTHASYVVNMSHVGCFNKEGFILRGGISVPIAAKQYSTVRDTYMDYIMKKGRTR